MEMFWLYLILQLNSISAAFGIALMVSAIVLFVSVLFVDMNADRRYDWETRAFNTGKTGLKWTAPVVVVSFFMVTILPSTKNATILAGAYALKEVAQTDTAQRLAGRSVKLIEDWLESLEPKKTEAK